MKQGAEKVEHRGADAARQRRRVQEPTAGQDEADMRPLQRLQALADGGAQAAQLSRVSGLAAEHAATTRGGVLQAANGWSLFDPWSWLPEWAGGYNQEQMVQHGYADPPAAEQAAAPEAQAAAPEAQAAVPEQEAPPQLPPPPAARNEEAAPAVASSSRGGNVRRRRRRGGKAAAARRQPPPTSAAAAAYGSGSGAGPAAGSGGGSASEDEQKAAVWEDDGLGAFTTVKKKGKDAAARARRNANRQARAALLKRVRANRTLAGWIDKSGTDGTSGMQGEGSARAHDLENRARLALKAGDVDRAIDLLDAAIDERRSDPNQRRNPDSGHTAAITYLQRLIAALRKI